MNFKNISIAIIILLRGLNAFSQTKNDTIKPINLQEIIVKSNLKTNPTLTVVKEDYTDKVSQPKNSGELFSDINGFSLIKRGNYAIDPSFRASQYEQLNVQFDGGTKAMHACPNRMDPITTLVTPEEVSKIEIIKGPYSVRFGPTFGGVINLVTNNPFNSTEKLTGTVSSGYEGNGNSFVNMVQLMSKIKKTDLSANFSQRDYGNYKDAEGNVIPSSFKTIGYGLKLGYNISENQRLQVGFRQNFGRDILHAGLPMDTKFDNSSIASVDYKFVSNSKHFEGVTAKGYYSYVDHEMNNYKRSSFSTMEAVARVNATTYGGELETQWNFGQKTNLFIGADVSNLARDGYRDRLVKKNMSGMVLPTPKSFTDKIWQNSRNNQAGIFAEGKYFLSEKDVFTYGGRLDFMYSNAKDLDSSFAMLYPNLDAKKRTNFSGTVAYRRKLNEDHFLEVAFGRGVISATMEEKYIAFFNVGEDPYEYVGNPNLKPEANNQFEISFKGKEKLKGFFNRISYNASVYYSIYENYIMGVVDSSLTRKYNPTIDPIHPKVFKNINNAFKTGFEVSGNLQFANQFNFTTELSYVYTENKDLNESLPLTPPLMTRLKLGYEKNKVWANLRYTIAARQNRISKAYDEIITKGYQVVDVEAGINPVKNLKVGFGVHNLLNRQYNDHLTYAFNNIKGFGLQPIPEPGRNFTIFSSYNF